MSSMPSQALLAQRLREVARRLALPEEDRNALLEALEQAYQNLPPSGPQPSSEFPYEDLGLIGMGGTGEVRRVRDRDLNRTMALKRMRTDREISLASQARFIQEAQTTAQLQHPGIVPVHSLSRLPDGSLYFTMQEVRGRTLEEVIREVHTGSSPASTESSPSRTGTTAWTFRRLIDAFHKVCEAVAYAHSRGVMHRDLKPANVMVGSFGEVMVLDWGTARIAGYEAQTMAPADLEPVITDRAQSPVLFTCLGTIAGTPAYMPPEQARGQIDQLSPASDVYALGAVLYEILAGRPPFTGPDVSSVLLQVVNGTYLPPSQRTSSAAAQETIISTLEIPVMPALISRTDEPPLSPRTDASVPPELEAICMKAMAFEPSDRYPNAAELAVEIGAWLEGARRQEQALKVVAEAGGLRAKMASLRAEAAPLAEEARRLLAELKAHDPVEDKRSAWALEDRARQLEREAALTSVDYLQTLRVALTYVPDLPEALALLADHYRDAHAAAEAARDTARADEYAALLRAYDRGQHAAYLAGAGSLTLQTDPPGAEVTLFRYRLQDRRLVPERVAELGRTPLNAIPIAMGSYLLELRAPGRMPVRYPVSIERLKHWDGVCPERSEAVPIHLPALGELEADDVYIPAGWFVSGGDPEAPASLPQRSLWVDGLVMRRFPVTNREYLEFLNALVRSGQAEEALRWAPRERGTLEVPGALIYCRSESGTFMLGPDADGDVWSLDWPVMMVDWQSARAYAAWEASRTGLPWRLPGELEWEKAGRGVDGRLFPWGDFLDPTWACMAESHEGRALPVDVQHFPIDESPYGVRGMAGNTRDWCLEPFLPEGQPIPPSRRVAILDAPDDSRPRVLRGGAWVDGARHLRMANRAGPAGSARMSYTGFRLVRSYP